MIKDSKVSNKDNQEDLQISKELKKSKELEMVNIAKSLQDQDFNQETEAQPLKGEQPFRHQTTLQILQSASKEKKFENTMMVQLIFSKIQLIQKLRLTVSLCLIFLTLTIYEFWFPYTDDYYTSKMFANVVTTILSLMAVAGYLLYLHFSSLHLIETYQLSQSANTILNWGIYSVPFYSLMIFLHPFYKLGDQSVFDWEEIYWDGSGKVYFMRDFNNYMTIFQITVHSVIIFDIIIRNSDWATPRVARICRLSGIQVDMQFLLKSLLVQKPTEFSLFINLFFLVYFSIVIRVIESGLQRSFKLADFGSAEDLQGALIGAGNFQTYKNSIWNMFITMSTIGYGEFNVQSTFSRFYLLFISVTGLALTSIMVVTASEYFELDTPQGNAFRFFNALELKIEMRKKIGKAIAYWTKAMLFCKKYRYFGYKKFFNLVEVEVDQYKLMKNQYYQSYGPEDLDIIDNYLEAVMARAYLKRQETKQRIEKLGDDLKHQLQFLFDSKVHIKYDIDLDDQLIIFQNLFKKKLNKIIQNFKIEFIKMKQQKFQIINTISLHSSIIIFSLKYSIQYSVKYITIIQKNHIFTKQFFKGSFQNTMTQINSNLQPNKHRQHSNIAICFILHISNSQSSLSGDKIQSSIFLSFKIPFYTSSSDSYYETDPFLIFIDESDFFFQDFLIYFFQLLFNLYSYNY